MFTIAEIRIDESVVKTKFVCDLHVCKGACCTFPGGRGAPLDDAEVSDIASSFPFVKDYLPPEHLAVIERDGLVDGTPGNYVTQCIDGKACVFVYYDGDIAKCAFERAFYEKRISWQKPISCHLFPIRIGKNQTAGKEIHYEYFSECAPALSKGERESTPVYEFAHAPLIRAFGDSWYKELNETITTKQS